MTEKWKYRMTNGAILFHNTCRRGYLGLRSWWTPGEIFRLPNNCRKIISVSEVKKRNEEKQFVESKPYQNSMRNHSKYWPIILPSSPPAFSLSRSIFKSIPLCSLLTEDQSVARQKARGRGGGSAHLWCPGTWPQRLEHAVCRECKPFQLTQGLALGIHRSPSGGRVHKP